MTVSLIPRRYRSRTFYHIRAGPLLTPTATTMRFELFLVILQLFRRQYSPARHADLSFYDEPGDLIVYRQGRTCCRFLPFICISICLCSSGRRALYSSLDTVVSCVSFFMILDFVVCIDVYLTALDFWAHADVANAYAARITPLTVATTANGATRVCGARGRYKTNGRFPSTRWFFYDVLIVWFLTATTAAACRVVGAERTFRFLFPTAFSRFHRVTAARAAARLTAMRLPRHHRPAVPFMPPTDSVPPPATSPAALQHQRAVLFCAYRLPVIPLYHLPQYNVFRAFCTPPPTHAFSGRRSYSYC